MAICHGAALGLIALLPVLMFLRGTLYQTYFVCCMIVAVLSLLRCLRLTDSSEQRQQVRWALFGITSYAIFGRSRSLPTIQMVHRQLWPPAAR